MSKWLGLVLAVLALGVAAMGWLDVRSDLQDARRDVAALEHRIDTAEDAVQDVRSQLSTTTTLANSLSGRFRAHDIDISNAEECLKRIIQYLDRGGSVSCFLGFPF